MMIVMKAEFPKSYIAHARNSGRSSPSLLRKPFFGDGPTATAAAGVSEFFGGTVGSILAPPAWHSPFRRHIGSRSRLRTRLHMLLNFLERFSQFVVLLLQFQHFTAQTLQFISRPTPRANLLHRPIRRRCLRCVSWSSREVLQHRQRTFITQ